MGLTMLFHTKLPRFLWVEAFLTVVFLINRLPSQAIQMESPFQAIPEASRLFYSQKFLGVDVFHI